MGLFNKIVDTAAKKVLLNAAGEAVYKTAGIVLQHESTCVNVKVPKSADDYDGMNYTEVEEELLAYGFENIALLAKRDLIKGWLTKPGAVEEVSIAGKTNFRKGQKYPANSRIVITYHDFR